MIELLVGLCLLGYCFWLTKFFGLPIETTPFILISGLIVLLYFFAYVHLLMPGTYLLLSAGALSLFATPILFYRDRALIFSKYLTPGFVFSLLLIIFFSFLSSSLHVTGWDSFTHWGPHAKFTFLNQGFIKARDVVIHKDYPPGSALFYYFFYLLGGFSESKTFIAQQLLLIAPLMVLVQRIQWKNCPLAFLGYAFGLLILNQLGVRIGLDGALYMDPAAGVFFGMILVMYRLSRRQMTDILWLILPVIALSLFKMKLFPLVLVITAIILIDQLMQKKPLIKSLCIVLWLPFSFLFVTQSWKIYLHKIHVPFEWKLAIPFSHWWQVIKGGALTARESVTLSHFWIALTTPAYLIIILVTLIFTTYFLLKSKVFRETLILDNTVMLLGFLAYLFGLLLMYLYSFGGFEGENLASFDRYTMIYMIAWWLVVYAGLFYAIQSHRFAQKRVFQWLFVIAMIGLLTFMIISHVHRVNKPNALKRSRWYLRQGIQTITNKVKQVTQPRDKIFTVWQNSSGYTRSIIVYELVPRVPNLGATSFGKPYKKSDLWTSPVSQQAFLKELKGFDYLLLAYTDQNFWQRYGSLLPKHLKVFTQYKICIAKGFDAVRGEGCQIMQEKAYLFKIINKQGRVSLKNIRD